MTNKLDMAAQKARDAIMAAEDKIILDALDAIAAKTCCDGKHANYGKPISYCDEPGCLEKYVLNE